MKVGSLFTGYGGLDIAVGGNLEWYAEIEPAACQVLKSRHPDVPNLGDITKIDWATVPPVDVLTGGYPCQPFSHAGLRKGKNDERHLWPYVCNAIDTIRPRYAILENVSGHLTLGFADVLADLATIGFNAEWGTFRASDVGAPHRRERLFIIAYPDSQGLQRSIIPRLSVDSERVQQRTAQSNSEGVSAYPARGIRRTGQGRGLSEPEGATRLATRVGAFTTNPSGNGHGIELHAPRMGSVEGEAKGSTQQRERTQGESDPGSLSTSTHTQHDGLDGGTLTGSISESEKERRLQQPERRNPDIIADTESNKQRESAEPDGLRPELGDGSHARPIRLERTQQDTHDINWGKYAPAIRRWESVLDRPAPAPTVERKDKRRLNPVFVEWMMGLDEGHVTGHGLSAAQELKMLGNGVVPQQARAAITQLMERITP